MEKLSAFKEKKLKTPGSSLFLKAAFCLLTVTLLAAISITPALANTYNVNSTTDFPITGGVNNATGQIIGGVGNGFVTLRSAIAAANNVAGPHTINLAANTYNLTIAGPAEGFGGDITIGDLDVLMTGVTIQGAGMNSTVINQTTGVERVFDVNVNYVSGQVFNFTIIGVTVSGGRASNTNGEAFGGGIYSGNNNANGTVTVTNCKFLNNHTIGPGFGGGALSNVGGNMVVTGCIFGGTNPTDFNQSATSGGAIYWDARFMPQVFTCTNNTFINNKALSVAAGGGAIDVAAVNLGSGTANISDCTFTGNTAPTASGGAITNESITINVTKCTFLNNSAINGGVMHVGGGIGSTINFCRFIGNTATGSGKGLSVAGASVTLNGNNNWWGVNTGPGANDAVAAGGATLTLTNWLMYTHTPGQTPLCSTIPTTLTASFLVNSAGTSILASDLTALVGVPIAFNNVQPAGSTVTNAQTTIQSNGQATATFTAGFTAGAGGANAVVDNATVHAAITVQTPPNVTLNPASQSICPFDPVTFTSAATGTPTPTVQWQRSTNGGMSFSPIGGATNTSYMFNVAPADNGNQYRAAFTNVCATNNSNAATLTVYPIENPDFAYAKTGYCRLGTDPTPTIYGTPGGIFSAPAQLVINTATGQIDVSASTVGGPFTVTYNTNGPCPEMATFNVTIVNCMPGATLTDMLSIDNSPVGLAQAGDRIKLTATVSNSQAADYEGVQLMLNNDPRVTFVAGSFKSTPVAVDDAYLATMNTPLNEAVGSGLLVNDFDNAPLNVTNFSNPSAQGGTVSVNANGSFTYTPMNGFTGNDTFTYTITDSDMQINTGTVRIRVQ